MKRILIVEDDPSINNLVFEVLTDVGYECVQAFDGVEAQEILREEHFNLILSDFRMPLLNGAKLLIWYRSLGNHTPFVFMTANKNLLQEELVAANDCCSSLLMKPFELQDLLAEVETSVHRKHDEHCRRVLAS